MAASLVFSTNDGAGNRQLFAVEPGGSGPVPVPAAAPYSWSASDGAASVGRFAVFANLDASGDQEPWVTDGTAAGTFRLADIRPGAVGSAPAEFVAVGGRVFFSAHTPEQGRELWVTDGTSAGTRLVEELTPGPASGIQVPSFTTRQQFDFDGRLLFEPYIQAKPAELWVSDGTAAGTERIAAFESRAGAGADLSGAATFGGRTFFSAFDGTSGTELWVTDGTAAGTHLLRDINPGVLGSSPSDITVFNGAVYFTAHDGNLWRSDGTTEGTQPVAGLSFGGASIGRDLTVLGDRLIFGGQQGFSLSNLYSSDGTAAGTTRLTDLAPESSNQADGFVGGFGVFGDGTRALFTAQEVATGAELWITDGTAAGTRLLKDIGPGAESAFASGFTALGDLVYFRLTDSVTFGDDLWVTDGTADGTRLVRAFGENESFDILGVVGATPAPGAPDVPGAPATGSATEGDDEIMGTDKNDSIDALGGDDVVLGLGGKDRLAGGEGSDTLDGGKGKDLLLGGEGNDLLIGAAGADVFDFNGKTGRDVVEDLGRGRDRIDLSKGGTTFDDLVLKSQAKGDDTLVKLGKDAILLVDVAVSEVTADLFDFG